MLLKTVKFNELFLLNGHKERLKIDSKRDTRIIKGIRHLFCIPYVNGRLETDRGVWLSWETHVELADMTPYEKVQMDTW